MKKALIVIFISSLISVDIVAQQLTFDQHKTISENSDGFGRPRVVLTTNDDPLIIW